jgi:hypothetical protein
VYYYVFVGRVRAQHCRQQFAQFVAIDRTIALQETNERLSDEIEIGKERFEYIFIENSKRLLQLGQLNVGE